MIQRTRNWVLGFCLMFTVFGSFVWADGPAVPAGSAPLPAVGAGAGNVPTQPGFGSMLLPFALMFGVIYFLMIRPQQKKAKEQQAMLTALAQGDQVMTQSGILGKIAGITDKVVTLEIADDVKIKMLKSQIAQVVKGQVKELV